MSPPANGVDVHLEVGDLAQTIDVREAAFPYLETDSSNRGQVYRATAPSSICP